MLVVRRVAPHVVIWLLLAAPASTAFAQVSNAALAESLFREGKRLMEEQRYSEACPKFAESNRLDPGLGTQLNLALCHESEGKLASAWAEFSEAMAQARREGDADREAFAREHVQALEPKLSKVTLQLDPGANVPGLKLKLDGKELSTAAVGVPVPIDPGVHEVEASAPAKRTFSQTIQIPPEPDNFGVAIPVLQDEAPTPSPQPAAPPGQPTLQASPQPSYDQGPQASGTNTPLIITAVATGAFAAGAVVTGLIYNKRQSDFEEANRTLAADRFDKRDSAKSMGVINLVLTGGAIAAAGLSVYFLVSGPSHAESSPPAAALKLSPSISTQTQMLTLSGGF